MRTILLFLATLLAAAGCPALAAPGDVLPQTPPAVIPDRELAEMTGKFLLPNGVQLALTVTSDTIVNGQLVLRTVLAVDGSARLQVFGRSEQPATETYKAIAAGAVAQAGGVTVSLDRNSGLQTLTPSIAVSRNAAMTVGGAVQDPKSLGLAELPLTPGGPAVATPDGLVSLQTVRGGSQVSFAGDQLSVVNLVGRAVATAIANSGNDRAIDTVTNIAIDARNLAPYQAAAAQMRVDALAIDATSRMMR